MMQDYPLFGSDDTSFEMASTAVQPSPKVVQSILNYARCIQNISVGDNANIKVYLN